MTTKKKKLALIKALGLEIGNIIKFKDVDDTIYLICEEDDDIFIKPNTYIGKESIFHLILKDWVKLKEPISYGNVICAKMKCKTCPLYLFRCSEVSKPQKTLYEILDYTFNENKISKDSNLYKTLKEELNKKYGR